MDLQVPIASPVSSPSLDFPVVVVPSEERDERSAVELTKVLHIVNGEHFSGAERVQQLLGKRLAQFGYDACFACVKPGKFLEQCELRGRQVSSLPMRHRLDLQVTKAIATKVRDEGFSLLHAHTPRTALIASVVASRTGVPWVYHVHSPTSRDSTRGVLNRINDAVERYAIRSCTRLLTVSRSLRREMLRQGVSRSKLSVVPNGVPAFPPIEPLDRLRQSSWRLGIVALMRPRKGIEVALDALNHLREHKVDLTLDLIGGFETPEYQQQIEKQICDLSLHKQVRLLGFRSDIATQIGRLDALLLPSLFGEGMPMVVLEALSAAVPVVATRVEGTPEVVRHGIEGYLAEPRNAESLATQILRLTADRRQWADLSHNALARQRSEFTDVRMAERVARAYAKALAGHPIVSP